MKKHMRLLNFILLTLSISTISVAEPIHFDSIYSTNYLGFLEKSNEMGNHIKEISKFLGPQEQAKIKTLFTTKDYPEHYQNSTKNIVAGINYLDTLPSINQSGSFLGLKQSYNSLRNFNELSQYESGISDREVWSDYYWAFEKGGLANRYLSKEYLRAASGDIDPNRYCEFANDPVRWLNCRNKNVYGCEKNDDVFCYTNYLKQDIPKIQANIYNLSAEKIRTLSPAEKYDLLIGDVNFTLTYKHIRRLLELDPTYKPKANEVINLEEVDPNTVVKDTMGNIISYKKRGDYAGWMGICEGVATAQTQMPAARKTIVLKSPLGFDIPFYPQDIRALASYMYSGASAGADANGQSARFFQTTMIGSRCNERKIRTLNNRIIDLPTTGKAIMPDGSIVPRNLGPADRCRDTAPSILHIATINSIGKMKRPFVMDSIPDDEVWNYPINEYSIAYFNPQTKAGAEDILSNADYSHSLLDNEQAFVQNPNKVLLTNYPAFTDDRYKEHRSDYTYIVGVKLTIEYIDGASKPHGQPVLKFNGNPENEDDYIAKNKDYITSTDDITKTMTFIYDLELDADKNIIGGEWYPFIADVQVTDINGNPILDENGQSTTKKQPMFSLPDMIFAIPDVATNNYNLPLTQAERARANSIYTPVLNSSNKLNDEWRAMALESTGTSQRSGQVLYNIIRTMVEMSRD